MSLPVAASPVEASRTVTRLGARLGALALACAAGFVVAVVVAVTLSALVGFRTLTVLSGSMTPTFAAGDLVVVQRISPLEAKVGDVITFRDPVNGARLITHRVRTYTLRGRTVSFVTRGDANSSSEEWAIPVDGEVGRAVLHVPKLGYVTARAGSRIGRGLLIALPALLLGALALRSIWAPAEARDARP